MALTLAEVSDPAERLAFVERAIRRPGRPVVARKTHRPGTVKAVTASAAPVSAPVSQPEAAKQRRALTLADLTAAERERIELCFHESGHAVAAVALSGVIRSAVVAAGGVIGVQGLTTVDEMPEGRSAEVAYSGAWCQARWLAGRRPSQRDVYAVLGTTGHRDDKALCAAGGVVAAAGVVPLLTRCWPAVVAVAQKLFRDGEVGHEDVCKALRLSDGGGPGSVELALIRSGSAPGGFTVMRAAL
jgi:hypothetical protein